MTEDERNVLASALTSLSSCELDLYVPHHLKTDELYRWDILGRHLMAQRIIAEFIGRPQDHMLPGEGYEDETDIPDLMRFTPVKRSADGDPLTTEEKKWLQRTILVTLEKVYGLGDGDDSVLRCARRRVAEVSGYPTLAHYRLLFETSVKPLYFNAYEATDLT